jgi:hypothetical protein
MKVHPVINVEYLKAYHSNPERFGHREAPTQASPDILVHDPVVQEIRGHRLLRGETELLAHYDNKPDHNDTWVDCLTLEDEAMVDAYMLRVKKDSSPKSTRQDRLADAAIRRAQEEVSVYSRPKREHQEYDAAWPAHRLPRMRREAHDLMQ